MSILPVPAHRSFSQLQTFQKCAHQWYLTKVAKVDEEPAVWFAAGTAVHAVIEAINHAHYEAGMQDV